jgi:hypothetical protein
LEVRSTSECELDVQSGVIYGFLAGMPSQDTVNLGAAHGALLQSTRGDTSMVTWDELKHVMKGDPHASSGRTSRPPDLSLP